ncbi:cation-transporting P-type ATPase [Spirillospora sp. NPDC000708]
MTTAQAPYRTQADEVAAALGTDAEHGLDGPEAVERLTWDGPSE